MLQPRKPLNLTSAKEILETERKPLDLSSANAILKKKDSSESVEPQEPQTPTTELPSEDGSLATQQPRKKFSLTQEDLKDIGKKQPTDMSGKPLLPNLKESQKVLSKIYKENQALEAEKKKFGDVFDKQLNIKPKVEESQYLKDRLSTIDTELINKTESFVVPELQYQFGDLGFKFEEARAGRDYVKATAPNGKTIEISLDNWQDKTSKSESEVLQKFIKENTPAKGLFVLEKTMREQDKKFNSEKQVDESVKAISNEVTALNAKQKQFLIKKSQFEKQLSDSGPSSELEQQRLALNEEMKSILEEEETIKQKSKRLDAAVGKYSIAKSKQGTWGGAIVDAINEGFSSISAGSTSLIADISTEIAPAGFGMSPKDLKDVSIDIANKIGIKGPSEEQTVDQWKKTLTENQLDKWEDEVDDYIKKDIKSRTLPYIRIGNREIFGDAATTKQFSDLKEKGFWGGAILGVAKSLPAMIGGAGPAGWAQRTAQMYAQISDGLAVEMENNPQFADITENEKLAITLPIGITSAVLEAYGLRNVMASKGVINSITMSALGRAGAGASAKTFRELVENEVESKLARGLITITAAGVAEFETGAAQELTETGFKVVYDKLKEKDMFNTPDSTVDLIENVLVAGAQEAVGGFVLGVPSGVSAAYSKKGFLKMDDATFETFANMANDEKMQSAYIASLKEKITQGIITEKEAKEQLNNYRNSAGLYRQLPDGLTTEQQKEAMNLLKEKRDLENFVEGKDPALVVKAKNRITEINDSLTKLSETDAIQEQSTTEVPVQSETGISETMEGRTPEAEPQVATEQVTQEEVTPSETITNSLPEDVKGTFLENILDKIYEYVDPITGDKLKGNIFFDGQEVVFTDSNKEFSLGTVQDVLSNNSLNATEVTPIFNISEDGTIDILQETDGIPQGKITPQGTGLKAIKTDKDGNVKRVVITDANGVTHSLKGELANDLAEVMMFDLAKQGGLTKKINNDETARETFNRGVREANAKRKGKDTQTGIQGPDRGGRVEEVTPSEVVSEGPPPAPEGFDIVTEQAPVAEEKFIIDGKEYTKEEAIAKRKNRTSIPYGSKMEYNGNDPQAKEFVDSYNKDSNVYDSDGNLKENYMKQEISKAFENLNFRKFGNLFRKHIDPNFKRSNNEKNVGGNVDKNFTWEEQASYRIGDRGYSVTEEQFRAFAKEAGISIPETKAEVTPEEVDKIKSDIEASKERLKKAWDKYKTIGIAFDPKNNLARDRELVKSLVEYAYNNIRLGSYEASKLIKDLAEQGFEITKDGAKFIMDRASKKVQREINKTVGVKKKPTEQKRINKAYAIGVATQRTATEEAKSEVKDLKGQVVDVFRAGIDAVKMAQATAKEKAKNIKEISQQLVKDIKELESTGKITPTQALNMISKFNKVNMLNEVSVYNFIDYMGKVFADADYDNKINVAKGKLKAAKKNINTKIGIADGLAFPLQTLFSINPSLIPIKNLERYMELVDMFSARQAVLQLDEISKVKDDVNEILDEIDAEQSLVEELSYRLNYSDNQVIEDGKLNYAATVKNMLKEGDITQEEAELMVKYKSEIVPKVEKSKATDEEIEAERKELENEVKKSTVNVSDLPTRDERSVAKRIAEHLKKPFIKQLSNVDLKNLLKAIDNINNGYLPHQAELILEKLDGFVDGKTIDNSIKKANLKKIAQLVNTAYNTIKSKMTDRDAIFEMIRRTPLFNIDQILGDFKTEDLYYALLGKSAKAEAKFTFELKTIQEKLQKAQNKVAKSFGLNPLKSKISNYKIKTYLIQLEHDSNPGDKRVNQASEYIKATIKHINKLKSQYNENDVKILEYILKEFAPDGNIDIDKLYNSFNSAEKEAIKTLQEVKKFESEKAEFTAAVIRGKRINPLNNHTHISVLGDNNKEDLDTGTSFANDYNNSLKPSTKAKSLMERTPGAKPINFDAYSTALRSAKYVLLDYHLTAPIRTARKAIKEAEVALEKDGNMSKEQQRIFNSVNDAFELALSDLVNNSYVQTSTGQDIINSISKQGYRAVLAGLGKSSIELLSNLGFVVFDPFTFYKGAENMGIVLSEDLPAIMNNSKSIQTNRVNASGLSGRMIDLGILDQSVGTKSSKTRGKIINKAQQVWNLTVKKFIKNPVELTADSLISSPDKVIMKPYWLGSYITELEKQLGRKVTKEGDLKKIAENDEQYMNENEAAIEAATRVADRKSKLMGATKNGFAGLLRGKTREGDKAGVTILKNFNAFMTNFMVYEYNAAKTGVMAAIGDGTMTRSEGASVLAGVITRMTVYNLLIKSTTAGVSGLLGLGFGLDDDDEEEEKTINQLVTQSLASTFASLMLGRDFGNISKTVVNYGFEEYVTKEYLEGLRTGEYDPYKDAILFNSLQRDEKTGEMETWENIPNFMGSYGPIAKTGALAVKVITSKDKKKADAIERQEKERNIRLPLEILGNSGYIPLYKEIRKSVMDDIYKDLKNKKSKTLTREEYYKLIK